MIYKKHLSEPWFTLIKLGLKTCEGRLNKGDFENMEINDTILLFNDDFGFMRNIKIKIIKKNHYKTFETYLKKETLKNCLPGTKSIKEGVNIYRKYYSQQDEKNYGVVAILFEIT